MQVFARYVRPRQVAALCALIPLALVLAHLGSASGAAPPPASLVLDGVVYDLERCPRINAPVCNSDFEGTLGNDRGIVTSTLGTDGAPVYAPATTSPTTHGKTLFDTWYHVNPQYNATVPLSLTLSLIAGSNPPTYRYTNDNFWPIDGAGWNAPQYPTRQQYRGDDGAQHNFHFTYAVHSSFVYQGGESFTFTGDDDVWIFVNGKRVVDLGGVHASQSATVSLDAVAASTGLVQGQSYTFDFFFAERHTTGSHFKLDTSVYLQQAPSAVTLARFAAERTRTGTRLVWRTAAEPGLAGFRLERSSGRAFRALGAALVPARGQSVRGASYRILDRTARPQGHYQYRLVGVDLGGSTRVLGIART